jgi:glycosyltransferase involved in cell wall biosynthesis
MKKILFSTTSFDTIDNGPAFFANILFEKVINSNQVDFRVLTEDLLKDKTERKKIYHLKLQQHSWNRFFYQFFRIYKYHKEALKISGEFKFNILIYNNAFTGLLSSLFLKKIVLVMINDYNRKELIEKGFGFNKNYFKNLLLFNFEKNATRSSNGVIVNSKFLKDTVHKMYGVSKSNIKVMYKGINLENYTYNLREDFSDTINILFVKGGFENGGFYELVDAIASLINYDVKLTLIGPRLIDHSKIEKYLKLKEIHKYEINGPMKPEKVREFFATADIFCVPSHKEALGVANMEALASGLPVVSTNVGGIPEVLDYGKAGWMVAPGQSNQLAEALKECIENDFLRIQKSEHGYQHVQQFNADNLIDNFLRIVDEVIDQDEKK